MIDMDNQNNQKNLQEEIFNHLDRFSDILVSIGHKKRIIILTYLLNGPKKFSFLEEKTDLRKTALAHHLSILSESKLVDKIERGIYKISQDGREFIQNFYRAYNKSSLKSLEIARTLQKRFFSEYDIDEKLETNKRIVSINPEFEDNALTLMGAITGVLKASGSNLSVEDIAGLTGQCFLTIVGSDRLWVTAPESHNLLETFLKVLESIGHKFSKYHDAGSLPSNEDFSQPLSVEDEKRARKLLNIVKKEIDKDKPVILWGIPVPEWGIVKGYKNDNYIVSTFVPIHEEFDNQIPYDKISAVGGIIALRIEGDFKEKIFKTDYKKSIERAISISKENIFGRTNHITGLEAYDRWIYLLENEEDRGTKYFGNSYLIRFFHAGKQNALSYLEKLGNKFKNTPQQTLIEKATYEYQKIVEIYSQLRVLLPLAYGVILKQKEGRKAAELISKIKEHEENGIKYLEQALENWE